MRKFKLQKNVSLKDLTTFKVGGRAEYYSEVSDIGELKELVQFAKENKLPITILGGGSNLLLSDEGIKGVVVKYNDKDINFQESDGDILVTVGAGRNWDDVVELAVKKKYQGIECLSGIPGSAGAAPIQNIGAYGQELKDVFVSLKAYDFYEDNVVTFNKQDCQFGYRDSLFKKPENKGRYLILEITLRLNKDSNPTLEYKSLLEHLKKKNIESPILAEVRQAVLELRGLKLEDPGLIGNAGSFFKNPIINEDKLDKLKEKYSNIPNFKTGNDQYKIFAGWLIDRAGWKGRSMGNARVSDKNALVITNTGNASSKDIKELANSIQKDVQQKFDIELEPEVNIL